MPRVSANKDAGDVPVRTTGRIKKPKAVFDPSPAPRLVKPTLPAKSSVALNATFAGYENRMSARTRSLSEKSQTEEEQQQLCLICQKPHAKGRFKAQVHCNGCQQMAHSFCLRTDFEQFELLKQKYKCDRCRRCVLCNDANADMPAYKVGKELITCCKCVQSYHLSCHLPSIPRLNLNVRKWKCNDCCKTGHGTGEKRKSSSSADAVAAKRISAAVTSTPITHSTGDDDDDLLVPLKSVPERDSTSQQRERDCLGFSNDSANASYDSVHATSSGNTNGVAKKQEIDFANFNCRYWSVRKVHQFMTEHFPAEAHVFFEQEIDGASLLLLTRSDFVKKMSLRLGPALRLYQFVLKLQTKSNDNTLGWNIGQ